MEESEPGLYVAMPIVGFQWVGGFGEQRSVGNQEFQISGVLGLPGSCGAASFVVLHERVNQLIQSGRQMLDANRRSGRAWWCPSLAIGPLGDVAVQLLR
jgi:hypothetical protein